VYPHLVLFSYGNYLDLLPCIIKNAPSVRVLHWTPKLQPVRAVITLTLAEVVSKSQTSEDVYPVVKIGNPVIQLDPIVITSSIGKGNGGRVIRMKVTNIEGQVPRQQSRMRVMETTNIVGRVPKSGMTVLPVTNIQGRLPRAAPPPPKAPLQPRTPMKGGGGGFSGAGASGKWRGGATGGW
jgi:hypothetical protein